MIITHPRIPTDIEFTHEESTWWLDYSINCDGMPIEAFYEENEGPMLFDSDDGTGFGARQMYWRKMTSICSTCPGLESCFSYALQNEEWGWWGGTSSADREALRAEYGIVLRGADDADAFDEQILAERERRQQSAVDDFPEVDEEEYYE